MSAFRLAETEDQFRLRVQGLASFLGWEWMHLQRALNDRGYWRTPVQGPIGVGFPDLMLVKGDRIVFVELKADRGRLTPAQERVLEVLRAVPCTEVYVWKPDDWDWITEVLGA